MERLVDKLRESREQLARESAAFFTETRDAGRGFLQHTVEAGTSAVARTRDAGGNLFATVRDEAGAWKAYVRARRELLSDGVRQLMSPQAVEARLLSTVHQGLAQIDGRVEGRLANVQETGANGNGKASGKRLPIADYDGLNAKEVVARLDALSAAELKAVQTYERRHKQRQTVLRATKQRLAN